jgi:hypothetical protein
MRAVGALRRRSKSKIETVSFSDLEFDWGKLPGAVSVLACELSKHNRALRVFGHSVQTAEKVVRPYRLRKPRPRGKAQDALAESGLDDCT